MWLKLLLSKRSLDSAEPAGAEPASPAAAICNAVRYILCYISTYTTCGKPVSTLRPWAMALVLQSEACMP